MELLKRFYFICIALASLLLLGLCVVPFMIDSARRTNAQRFARFIESEEEGTEPGPSNPDGALKFRRLQLQDQNGYIPPDGLEKARQHVRAMRSAQLNRPKKQSAKESAGIKPDSWIWLGPGNVGGRIRSIVIHPTNPNKMWVGSVSGGIWTTTNGGNFWSPVNDFLANLSVSTMIIDPANPSVMYAGTGEGYGNGDAIRGAGVFRSTDSGATWNQLTSTNNPNFYYVNRLAISPTGNVILAATNNGIFRSMDSGTTWTQRTGTQSFDVDFRSATLAIAGGRGAAQFTTDGGQSWTVATFSPPITGRVDLAYAPSFNSFVYAAVDQNNGDVYSSNNGGQSYSRVNSGTGFFQGSTGSQGWYDNVIWVSPTDPSFVIVGGVHLWRSTDSGNNFTQISNGSLVDTFGTGSPHADHHVIVAHPGFNNTTNRTVYFGNDGGIYRTDNVTTASQTSSWIELNNGLGITQFYGAAGNVNSGLIVGGAQDNGTLAGLADGFHTETWTSVFGNDGGVCAADPTNINYFYGESQNLQLNRSDNGGVSAVPIFNGIADTNPCRTCNGTPCVTCNCICTNFIAPFVLDPNFSDSILAGGFSLWRSNDVKSSSPANPTWNIVPKPNPNNSLISSITISPGNSNFILVGHNNGDIYRTFNGVSSSPIWTGINTPLFANHFVTRLVIDNTRTPNWIYATFGGFTSDNVYRSTDLGTTWTDITGIGTTSLPNVPVRSLVYHPNNPNLLYVGTEIGIFTSDDAGATWEPTQNGPANVSVDELFWMGNDLIAVTHGRGIYRASGGIYVDCSYLGFENGSFSQPFRTIAAAINAVTRYQTIWIRPCTYTETINTNKKFEMRSTGGTVRIVPP